MYRHHYGKGESVLQSIDINTLKKIQSSQACKLEQNKLTFITHPNAVLLIIGTYALVHEIVQTSESQFNDFSFESVPRQFQQFSHQKTASEIFNILKKQVKSVEVGVQLFNNYPIFVHILECWVRKRTMTWIEANPSLEYMGNQMELLGDLSNEIRGPLLSIIGTCFRFFIKLKYQILPSTDPLDGEEELGDPTTKWELQVEVKTDGTSGGILFERESQMTSLSNIPSKASECGYLRRSKMVETETDIRVGGEFKSVKKQRPGYCQRCGYGKRCDCNQIKRRGFAGGYGLTPKNNSVSTNNAPKGQPFPIAFLNQHNISKIRESNPSLK